MTENMMTLLNFVLMLSCVGFVIFGIEFARKGFERKRNIVCAVLCFIAMITSTVFIIKGSKELKVQRTETAEQLLIERGVGADMASDTLEDVLEILDLEK